jgi:large subunit ribosomal protein L18
VTLASASTLSPEFKQKNMSTGSDVEAAKAVGQLAAEEALRQGIKEVVFDKNGFKYHGKIRALAEAAREQGLKF